MQDSDRTVGRGSELFVGMLVVAFLVFLLWFLLLRPEDPNTAEPAPTQSPVVSPTAIIDDPNRAFQNVIATPTPNPTPTATPVARPTPTPTPFVYTVQAGDTLSAIAGRFGLTVEELVQANRLVDPDSLQIGQQITIPSE
ncbi:MAG: LysM domain-containing protein [Chloroflexota bacterium]|nr:LysM domain-containing protein [Chloroflexota bacterium]